MTEPIVLQAAGLRVEFTRQRDRIAHRILADEPGKYVPLLESVEGTPDDVWPASPPWQEVHRESRGGVPLALAVGKAGSNHWSASFELDSSGRLTIDVACRAAGIPEQLGSTYRLHVPAEVRSPSGPAWLARDWNLGTEASDDPCVIELIDFDDSPARLAIRPAINRAGDWPRTVRWKYVIEPTTEPRGP